MTPTSRTVMIDGPAGRRVLRTAAELQDYDRRGKPDRGRGMTSQSLIDFERAMYCERTDPDCGACTLAVRGRDCRGVEWVDRRNDFDAERTRAGYDGGVQ